MYNQLVYNILSSLGRNHPKVPPQTPEGPLQAGWNKRNPPSPRPWQSLYGKPLCPAKQETIINYFGNPGQQNIFPIILTLSRKAGRLAALAPFTAKDSLRERHQAVVPLPAQRNHHYQTSLHI